jgi:predicted glycoside hydrolase/deacetylase ChbG (UPF0249 family)
MTPARPIAICVCADDYGLDPGVNEGITRLAESDRLQAVSAMVGAPAFRSGVAALARLGDRGIDIGLHFDLTQFPLRESASGLSRIIAACLAGRISPDWVGTEFRAQLDAFESALGRTPDFVDGHQHVHQLPGIADIVVAEIARRGIRPWLRCSRPKRSAAAGSFEPKSLVIDLLGRRRTSRLAAAAGLRQNRSLLGVYGFDVNAGRYIELLRGWLIAAETGDLLMCHPALGSDPADPIRAARRREYEVLSGDAWSALIAQPGVALRRMTTILADDARGARR